MSVKDIVPATTHETKYLNKVFAVEKVDNEISNADCASTSSSSEEEDGGEMKKIDKPAKSTICIDNSNDVVIGPVTQIHGPITIHQALPQISNHVTQNNTEEKPPAKLVTSENATNPIRRTIIDKCHLMQKRYVIIGTTICILIFVIGISTALSISSKGNDREKLTNDNIVTLKGNHHVYEKNVWHGREVDYKRLMRQPAKYVIISHTAGSTCRNFTQCASLMQQLQAHFVGNVGLSDIGQNFLIAHDDNIYVGRGWDLRNMHTDDSVAIGYLGNFVFDELNPGMIEATLELIKYGIREKKISPDYILVGQNQTYPTDSPGKNVYKVIKTWRHFDPRFIDKFGKCSYYGIGIIILLLTILITIIAFINAWRHTYVEDVIDRDNTGSVTLKGGHKIFEKYDWGGRETQSNQSQKLEPFNLIRISATGRRSCDTYATCSTIMQELQSNQVNNGFVDIFWNFAVGGDSNVYVGRGWNYTNNENSTMNIGTIGRKPLDQLTRQMKEAISELINYGVILEEINADYVLVNQEFELIANISL